MLSGIVFHAGLFYTCTDLGTLWPLQEVKCHLAYDVICGWLHLFRIPAFFAVAGFFAALVLEKRGLGGFSMNRFHRIVRPFVFSWILLFPMVMLIFYYMNHLGEDQLLLNTFTALFSEELIGYKPKLTIHLWFLYYLFFFYVLLLLIRILKKPGSKRPLWIVLGCMMILSGLGFFFSGSGEFNGSYSFSPELFSMLGFAPFFFFGYFLFYHQQWIIIFRRSYLSLFVWTILPFVFYLIIRKGWIDFGEILNKVLLVFSSSVFSWLMLLALIGWVSEKFIRSQPVIRYLSDASYWIYLVHLPLVMLIGGVLNSLMSFSLLVWLLNILISASLSLISYHFLVRSTFVGKWLNGKTYSIRQR